MARTYQKPRGFTYEHAVKRAVRGYEARNRAEDRPSSFEEETKRIARQRRTRLVAENPTMPDAEIDAMLERIMSGGRARSTEELRPSRGIPKEVLAERRAERRREVKKGAPHRR